MFNANIFKERLKIAREESGLNQGELAKIVGVTKASISYYESPTAKTTALPNAKVLYEITRALGVSFDYLVGNTDYKTPTQQQDVDNIAANLLNTIQGSDTRTCTQALQTLIELIQESTVNSVEQTMLPAMTGILTQLHGILSAYQSHTVDNYHLHMAINADALASNHKKLVEHNKKSFMKEFTYEAFAPTIEIQDTVQNLVSSLQNQLLAVPMKGGINNGDD